MSHMDDPRHVEALIGVFTDLYVTQTFTDGAASWPDVLRGVSAESAEAAGRVLTESGDAAAMARFLQENRRR